MNNTDKNNTNYQEGNSTEMLEFDNFNFKLAIIQILMYDLKLLTPYFDIYEFAKKNSNEQIDTDSPTAIPQAIKFFKDIHIPRSLADKVEKIYMDGGDDIYMNIAPQWDGEDAFFDLTDITEKELRQFPNLKSAIIMTEQFDEVSKVFTDLGIKVKLL